jgi:hypothetical protein
MEIVMRTSRAALLTGTAALALVGLAGMVSAQTPESSHGVHVLTVRLPNGQMEQVRYTGAMPPTITLAPDVAPSSYVLGSPFAMLERMSADMDRQAAALFQALDTQPALGAERFGPAQGAEGFGPAQGAEGFGIVPALAGPGVCSRSVQITFMGNGQAPHVVSRTAGDCGPAGGSAVPAALPNAPAPRHAPDLVMAKAENPYHGLVQPVGDSQR